MALPGFFRSYKHKVFDYKPIYYNQKKEELEKIIRDAERDAGVSNSNDRSIGIRKGTMRSQMKHARASRRKSNMRLFIILLVLAAFAYYFFA